MTDDFFADGDLERIERHRQRLQADGKHMIGDGVEFDKEAMLAAVQDSKEWQQQLDADSDNLIEDWVEDLSNLTR